MFEEARRGLPIAGLISKTGSDVSEPLRQMLATMQHSPQVETSLAVGDHLTRNGTTIVVPSLQVGRDKAIGSCGFPLTDDSPVHPVCSVEGRFFLTVEGRPREAVDPPIPLSDRNTVWRRIHEAASLVDDAGTVGDEAAVVRLSAAMRRLRGSFAVGLLDGKVGNSESGHLCIGAGRVVIQDDLRIEMAMQNGTFSKNSAFLKAMRHVRKKNGALHLIALLSKKSSHGSMDYPVELLQMAKGNGIKDVFVHAIFDGRGERSRSAALFLEKLDEEMTKIGLGQVVSGIGRAMALDRNNNYPLTRRAYEALVFGVGRTI